MYRYLFEIYRCDSPAAAAMVGHSHSSVLAACPEFHGIDAVNARDEHQARELSRASLYDVVEMAPRN